METTAASRSTITMRPVVEQTRIGGCLSYLLYDPRTNDAAVIDPRADGVDAILARLEDGALNLRAAIDTHAHADHVSGVARLAAETGAEAIVSSDVAFAARVVREGDEVKVGNFTLRVIATPGHTSESVSLQVDAAVFTGDALLIGGAGRTDFQNGSPETLWNTFEKKLRGMDPGTVVYPAHDYRGRTHTTIGDELRANRLFAQTDRSAFIARLSQGRQPEPANMRLVLAANRAGTSAEASAIDPRSLRARIEAGEALNLIDVRSPAEFAGSRMRGARNVPLEQIGAAAPTIPAGEPVVLICESGTRATIAGAAFAGRPNVMVLTGGMGAWRKAGFGTEGSGGGIWSLERQVRLVAGTFVLLGAILGLTAHPWFFAIPVFFGAGLTFSGLTGWCGMAHVLAKLPWNRRAMAAPAQEPSAGGSCAADGGGMSAAGSCAIEPTGGSCAAG
jgi:glyoxylase-like metal-dependent hydrolase (beta-lactamase superfamily II)